MNLPQSVSQDEWLAARKDLLKEEKEVTLRWEALNARRRELPMVKLDKEYVFEGDSTGEPVCSMLSRAVANSSFTTSCSGPTTTRVTTVVR